MYLSLLHVVQQAQWPFCLAITCIYIGSQWHDVLPMLAYYIKLFNVQIKFYLSSSDLYLKVSFFRNGKN